MKITIAGIRYLGSLEKYVTALLGDDDRHLWARKATEPKLPRPSLQVRCSSSKRILAYHWTYKDVVYKNIVVSM